MLNFTLSMADIYRASQRGAWLMERDRERDKCPSERRGWSFRKEGGHEWCKPPPHAGSSERAVGRAANRRITRLTVTQSSRLTWIPVNRVYSAASKKQLVNSGWSMSLLLWLSHWGADFRLPGEAQMCAVIRSRASHHRERGRDLHVTARLQSVSAKSSEVGQSVWWDGWRRVWGLRPSTAQWPTGPGSHTHKTPPRILD